MIGNNHTVPESLRAQWVFHNIHCYQFSRKANDDWLQWSHSCRKCVFSSSGMASSSCIIPLCSETSAARQSSPWPKQKSWQFSKWPRSSCHVWRTLDVRFRGTVICAEPRFSTLLCPRVQSSPTLRFGHQQGLHLGKCWETALLLAFYYRWRQTASERNQLLCQRLYEKQWNVPVHSGVSKSLKSTQSLYYLFEAQSHWDRCPHKFWSVEEMIKWDCNMGNIFHKSPLECTNIQKRRRSASSLGASTLGLCPTSLVVVLYHPCQWHDQETWLTFLDW